MQRKGSAVWQGGLKDGKGSISTDSGVLKQTQYSFSTRFENGVGTNPEELLAAAHAGCFTMALSAQLGNAGMTASRLETTATISLDKLPDGFAITKSHLDLVAQIPGADKAKFDAAVKAAETACPVSKLLRQKSASPPGWYPRTPRVLTGRSHQAFSPDDYTARSYRTFSSRGPNRYNATHDFSSRSVRCRCRDLSDRALGCVRGHHLAPPRHAKVPSCSPVLPLHMVHMEIRNVPHPQAEEP